MTRDSIIRMAREAGFDQSNSFEELIVRHSNGSWVGISDRLERFAALIAAAEREACAKVCEDIDMEYHGEEVLATWCAEAIRARGEK